MRLRQVQRPGSMIDKLMRYINRHVYKNAENVIVLGTEMKTTY